MPSNPDLIFEEDLNQRVDLVVRHFRKGIAKMPALERVTLFVTDRCNLACRYCNGPHLIRNTVGTSIPCLGFLPLQTYKKWLAAWTKVGLKHLHFTGGEPCVHPQLTAFVKLARAQGVLCSVTSNGALPLKTYMSLLRAGLSEIRLSIDSQYPRRIDKIVGRKGAGRKLLENIRSLVKLKRSGRRNFWLVLNSCLDKYSARELYGRISALKRLGSDDLKILVVAQKRDQLRDRANRDTVEKLSALVSQWRGFELLKRKLKDMFRRKSAGLRDPYARKISRHCMIPLLERTADEKGLYPCSIYKRHNGKLLALAGASPQMQQRAVERFSREHDCRKDPICIQHCVSCCKEMNLRANESLAGLTRRKILPRPRKSALREPAFLLIKPPGMPRLKKIVRYLRSQGVSCGRTRSLKNWHDLALRLYGRGKTASPMALARNLAFRKHEKGNSALLLDFECGVSGGKLNRLKEDLRRLFPCASSGYIFEGQYRPLVSNVVHTPDSGDGHREWELLRQWA